MTANSCLPSTYYSSDRLAVNTQRLHFLLLGLQLSFLFLASLAGVISVFARSVTHIDLPVLTAVLLVLGLLATWINGAQGYEKTWFDARAVAESVKTVAWRYMMQAHPFDEHLDPVAADTLLVDELRAVLEARRGVSNRIVSLAGDGEISPFMRETRSAALALRKRVYNQDRLNTARSWYESKARANQRAATSWFWGVVVAQMFAVIVAITRVNVSSIPFGIVALFMMLTALFSAWTQARKHDELSQAYALAAQELRALEALQPHITSQEGFGELVIQVEEAISREHTMWCARRRVVLA